MAFDLGLGSLIAGGISAIGNLFSNIGSKNKALQAVRETNDANKALAQYQYETNLDMWNRQNEYNSPLNQMQRLKDAGLNPNLMYEQGNVGNASNAPEYHAPNLQAYTGFGDFGVSSATNALMQGLSGFANIKKTEAETENIRQNTNNLGLLGTNLDLRNGYQMLLNSSQEEKNKYIVPFLKSQIANMDSTSLLNNSRIDLTNSQQQYTDKQRERFEILTPLVYQQVETSLKQALFDYFKLSPAKLNVLMEEGALKSATRKLTELNSKALFNEIEFGEKSTSWNIYKREYDAIMMEYEKSIKDTLLRNGINLKSSNWFTPLLYEIEQQVALPVEQLINNIF